MIYIYIYISAVRHFRARDYNAMAADALLPLKNHLLNDAWKRAVRNLSALNRHEYRPQSSESHERIAVTDEGIGEPTTIVTNGENRDITMYGNVQLVGHLIRFTNLSRHFNSEKRKEVFSWIFAIEYKTIMRISRKIYFLIRDSDCSTTTISSSENSRMYFSFFH